LVIKIKFKTYKIINKIKKYLPNPLHKKNRGFLIEKEGFFKTYVVLLY